MPTERHLCNLGAMPVTTYDLRSDTVTQPSPAMKRAMVEAPLGDDVLGDDPTVKRLEALISLRTGKEAGLFFPSGTQANETAVNVHAPPGTEILVERRSHIYNFESGGPAALSGVQVHPVETAHGVFDVEDLDSRIRPVDPHCPQMRLLCMENTHNGHGGRIYPIEEMEEASEWARGRGLAVHLDGARLFNASVASGIPVPPEEGEQRHRVEAARDGEDDPALRPDPEVTIPVAPEPCAQVPRPTTAKRRSVGGGGRIRTCDPGLMSPLLYQAELRRQPPGNRRRSRARERKRKGSARSRRPTPL